MIRLYIICCVNLISAIAMTISTRLKMQCKSRITNEHHKLPFGDGKHYFYPEMRCIKIATEGSLFCSQCSHKRKNCKIQGSRLFDHGEIGCTITPGSHIHGGEWYNKHKEAFLEPSTHTIELLHQYAEHMSDGYKVYTISDIQEMSLKKRQIKINKPSLTVPQSQNDVVTASILEKGMNELEVDAVEHIQVSKFTHANCTYYKDTVKGKLYKMTKEGVVGPYIGRWDSVSEEIIYDIDDSDSDN